MNWISDFSHWLELHPHWLALAVFITALGECLAIVGWLVPGTVLLLAMAVLAGSGALNLQGLLLAGFSGGLLGDLLSYAIGRRYHQGVRRLPVLRSHPQWLAGADQAFARFGTASLIIGRFIGPLRPALPMLAGMLDMPLLRFFAISVLASAGWALAYLIPGWYSGAALNLPLPKDFWPQASVLLAALTLIAAASLYASLKEKPYSALLSGLLISLGLALVLLFWPRFSALDQGLMTLVHEQRNTLIDSGALWLTSIGDWRAQLPAAMLLIGLLALFKQQRAAVFVLLSTGGAALLNQILKHWIARSRPEWLLTPLDSFSMPSGHSSGAFALFICLGVLLGRGQPARWRLAWLWLLAPLPVLIALSRPYLGAHWPSDILAGALLAAACCALSLALVQQRSPLPAPPRTLWWVLMPMLTALLIGLAAWQLPKAALIYLHSPA